MTQEPTSKPDYRLPTAAKWAVPRAVAEGSEGTIIAVAEIAASPERVFQALTTNDVERWWGHPDYYRQTDWKADLKRRHHGKGNFRKSFVGHSSATGSGKHS